MAQREQPEQQQFRLYFTVRGEAAKRSERAHNLFRSLVHKRAGLVVAQNYHTSIDRPANLTDAQLPVLVDSATRRQYQADEAITMLLRLQGGGGSQGAVRPKRYVAYMDDAPAFSPSSPAIVLQSYRTVVNFFKDRLPPYLSKVKHRLPVLVTQEDQPTVWYGVAAVDQMRMIDVLDTA